jgi:hypothetical protein
LGGAAQLYLQAARVHIGFTAADKTLSITTEFMGKVVRASADYVLQLSENSSRCLARIGWIMARTFTVRAPDPDVIRDLIRETLEQDAHLCCLFKEDEYLPEITPEGVCVIENEAMKGEDALVPETLRRCLDGLSEWPDGV